MSNDSRSVTISVPAFEAGRDIPSQKSPLRCNSCQNNMYFSLRWDWQTYEYRYICLACGKLLHKALGG